MGRPAATHARAVAIALAVVALGLSGCGQTIVTVTRPTQPISFGCHGPGMSDARQLLGLSLHAVEAKIPASFKGCEVRPVEIDGRHLALDGAFSSKRIDVVVESGLIVRIAGSG
jgi:uncharacterized protein YceK